MWISNTRFYQKKKIANSIDNSSTQSFNENELAFRRRKNYLSCGQSKRNRFRNLIRLNLDQLAQFCENSGLQINEIILSGKDNRLERTRITIKENEMPKEHEIFKCIKAKDLASTVKSQIFTYDIYIKIFKNFANARNKSCY